jgi:hypothetical protein
VFTLQKLATHEDFCLPGFLVLMLFPPPGSGPAPCLAPNRVQLHSVNEGVTCFLLGSL